MGISERQNCEAYQKEIEESFLIEGQIVAERFLVNKLLAKGGMGTVYLAEDLHFHKKVVIKLSEHEELRGEAVLQNELTHQAFPRVFDVLKVGKNILLIMEYIEGLTLKEYIERKGALTEEEAFAIGRQIWDALAFLHTRRPAVFYQDLKPDNVMIQEDGRVRLIDLGAAVQRRYDGASLQVIGTRGYAAPEQLLGSIHEVDARSDIYALGTLFYSMITGIFLNIPPYTMDLLKVVCPEASHKIAYLIEKSTLEDKEKRFQSVHEIQEIMDSVKSEKYFEKRRKKEIAPIIHKKVIHKKNNSWLNHGTTISKEKRTPIKRTKAIFLSAKAAPGLWVCTWLLQLVLCFLGGLYPSEINAPDYTGQIANHVSYYTGQIANHAPDYNGQITNHTSMYTEKSARQGMGQTTKKSAWNDEEIAAEQPNERSRFPLTIYDNEGRKLLIKHGAVYQMEGSLFFELPCDALTGERPEILTISLKNSLGEDLKERTFFLERK